MCAESLSPCKGPADCLSPLSPNPLLCPDSQDWADLPDILLHSIVALLCSFLDLLSFDATCRSWHAAFCSYPSKSTFCTSCLPLLIQPQFRLASSNGCRKICKVIDPAHGNTIRGGQVLQETLQEMHFVGSSYGQLICCHHRYCLVVDALSGAEVSLPRLPLNDYSESELYYSGTLTASLASPNSHLLISTKSFLFDWSVGSHSWSGLYLPDVRIEQIVEFNGQFIAMDNHRNIYRLQLAPQLDLQEINAEWCGHVTRNSYFKPWLVVCDDMLLTVSYRERAPSRVSSLVLRLDMSTEPALWVEAMDLDNWALFVATDARSPPFSCKSPERWGRRSNSVYCTHYSLPWDVRWLVSKPDLVQDPSAVSELVFRRVWYRYLQALWVYPSRFCSDGQ